MEILPSQSAQLDPVGAANSFCWCALTPTKISSCASLIDAGFTAHPSMLVMPTDIEKVKLPLCISNGTLDIHLKPDGMEVVKGIFKEKEKGEV